MIFDLHNYIFCEITFKYLLKTLLRTGGVVEIVKRRSGLNFTFLRNNF
jgi:hypothetical protein